VVLAGGWYLGPAQTQPAAQTVSPGTLMFPDLAARLQNAAEIDVTHHNKTLVIQRKGNVWGLADRGGYPVQAEKLRSMLTALTELRLVEPRTADPAQYAQLGVGDPNAPNSTADLLRVLDASGKPIVALIVGHRRVLTEGDVPDEVFVRRPNEAQSWLAEGSLEVDADPGQWLVLDIMNIDHQRLKHVSVQRGGTTLAFDAANGKLTMTEPASHPPLDDFKVDELAEGLESLTCEDVVPGPAPQQNEIGQSVFTTSDGMTITTRLYASDKHILARFDVAGTSPEAKQLNARIGGWTYRLASWKEAALVPALTDLQKSPETPAPATGPKQ
jgi:hypothetical protein